MWVGEMRTSVASASTHFHRLSLAAIAEPASVTSWSLEKNGEVSFSAGKTAL